LVPSPQSPAWSLVLSPQSPSWSTGSWGPVEFRAGGWGGVWLQFGLCD
jgi:hypothetical protein